MSPAWDKARLTSSSVFACNTHNLISGHDSRRNPCCSVMLTFEGCKLDICALEVLEQHPELLHEQKTVTCKTLP